MSTRELAKSKKQFVSTKYLLKRRKFRSVLKAYLFLLPISIFVILFSYYPFLRTFIYSLSTVDVHGKIKKFVGFKNYVNIFSRPDFANSIIVTFKFTLMYVPLAVILPLGLALIAADKKPFSNVYQTLYALPMAVSMSAACLIFKQFYHRKVGIVNYLLNQMNLMRNITNIDWLNNERWALPSLAAITIWLDIGFSFMLLLAAVRNVPDELLEAADLDGAGYWRKTLNVTLPTISPTLFFIICIRIVSGLTMAGPVMILTKGGPLDTTSTLIYYVYTAGFRSNNYTLGSTASICAFLITFVFLLINFTYEKKGVVYE